MVNMNKYTTPTVETLELDMEAPVLSTSTETFNEREVYDGEWA